MTESNYNLRRSEVRSQSKLCEGVRCSLQECSLSENQATLEGFIESFKNDSSKQTHLKALLYIFQCLMATVPTPTISKTTTRSTTLSFMTFCDAFDIFKAFKNDFTGKISSEKDKKASFRDLLCHKRYGLCVYLAVIQDCEYIILRPDSLDFSLDHLLPVLSSHKIEITGDELTREYCQDLVRTMDSEWDKCVLRVILALGRTNPEYESLGFDSDRRRADKLRVDDFLAKDSDLNEEAERMVIENLTAKKSKLEEKIKKKKRLLVKKQNIWTEPQIADQEEEVEELNERLSQTLLFLSKDEISKKSFTGMIARKKEFLINAKKLKKRKQNAGRKRLMDEDDEQYVAKCITDKATAHGRRKDTVLYLNHRVKKKDLLKLVNHRRAEKNLKLLKSATAIYNRSRPRNIRSMQAKRYMGLALFCFKKSPKSEESSNILNHFCLSRKKNVSLSLCKDMVNRNLVLFRSFDDKAYLCPGTKTGMDSTRKQKVLTVTNEEKARKFKKYDWPNTMLSITPGVTLYMTKSMVTDENGDVKIRTDSEDVVVAVKPKYFVGSSGSVWHGHLVENRHRESILHEIPNDVSVETYSVTLRNDFSKLRDYCNSFVVQTMEKDILNIVVGDCRCRSYELSKMNRLMRTCKEVASSLLEYASSIDIDNIHLELTDAIAAQENAVSNITNFELPGKDLLDSITSVAQYCKTLIGAMKLLKLPLPRPRIIDLTDAGPGVGITNHEAYYRISQEINVCNYDYYIRIHPGPGDSSKNDVERYQSSVGDAIADGGYMEWEHETKFEGLSNDEIEQMTPEQLSKLELDRMKKNAFLSCDEVTSRIDGNVAPNGYMKAFTSPEKDDLFFWDTQYLIEFLAEKNPCPSTPGYHFYTYLDKFMRSHARIGEKYLEFVKQACVESNGQLCDFCTENPFHEGKSVERVPEPLPDYSHTQKFKYMPFDKTVSEIAGKKRPIDDFNPRVQLKNWVADKKISLDEPETIEAFSKKYIVEKPLIIEELTHLNHLSLTKKSRSKERKKKKEEEMAKKYDDFNWASIIEDGTLKKLVHKSLNKYLQHHRLGQLENLLKKDKVDAIIAHYYSTKNNSVKNTALVLPQIEGADGQVSDEEVDSDISEDESRESDDSSEEDNDDADEVLNVIDEDRNVDLHLYEDDREEAEEDYSLWEHPSWFTTTRSGRVTGNPNLQNIYGGWI